MTTMLTRISAIAESQPTESLNIAAKILTQAATKKNRDPVDIAAHLMRLVRKLPDDKREAVLALVEALNKP